MSLVKRRQKKWQSYCDAGDAFCDSGHIKGVHLSYVQTYTDAIVDYIVKMTQSTSTNHGNRCAKNNDLSVLITKRSSNISARASPSLNMAELVVVVRDLRSNSGNIRLVGNTRTTCCIETIFGIRP